MCNHTSYTSRYKGQDFIFSFGGQTGGKKEDQSNSSYLLNLSQDDGNYAWRKLFITVLPPTREGACGCFVQDRMWIFGGRSYHYGMLNDLWALNCDNVDFDATNVGE